jgi:hypothetical protein
MTRALERRTKLAAGLAAITLAVAGSSLFVRPIASGAPRKHAATAGVSLAASFAVLSRAPDSSVPANLAAAVRHAPSTLHLDIAGARYVGASDAWLIPGSGWLCIATTDQEGLGMSCGTAASALSGKLAFVERTVSDESETILGAAPDGNREVLARSADGVAIGVAPVRENTYRLVSRHIQTTTLTAPSIARAAE